MSRRLATSQLWPPEEVFPAVVSRPLQIVLTERCPDARRIPRSHRGTPIVTAAAAAPPVTSTLKTSLAAQTRVGRRPQRSKLSAPTVIGAAPVAPPLGPLNVHLTPSSRTGRRPILSRVSPPELGAAASVFRAAQVNLTDPVKGRARRVPHSRLAPPTVIAPAAPPPSGSVFAPLAVHLADQRVAQRDTRRAPRSRYWPPPPPAAVVPGPRFPIQTTIADDGTYNAFPWVCYTRDGRLMAVYRKGVSHTSVDGKVVTRTSGDGGTTWGGETVLFTPAAGHDYRDPSVALTSTGRLVVNFFDYDGTNVRGIYTSHSDDSGITWSSLPAILTPYTSTQNKGATSGGILPVAGPALLMPVYGRNGADAADRMGVLRSTDDGATWGAVVDVSGAASNLNETTLILLGDGTVRAYIRQDTTPAPIHVSESTDQGVTWGAISALGWNATAGRPAAIRTGLTGQIFLMYRSTTATEAVYRYSTDGGTSWSSEQVYSGSPYLYAGGVARPGTDEVAVVVALEINSTDCDVLFFTWVNVLSPPVTFALRVVLVNAQTARTRKRARSRLQLPTVVGTVALAAARAVIHRADQQAAQRATRRLPHSKVRAPTVVSASPQVPTQFAPYRLVRAGGQQPQQRATRRLPHSKLRAPTVVATGTVFRPVRLQLTTPRLTMPKRRTRALEHVTITPPPYIPPPVQQVRVSQEAVEVERNTTTAARVSQSATETARNKTSPSMYLSHAPTEIVRSEDGDPAVVSQLAVEVLCVGTRAGHNRFWATIV